MSVLGKLKFWKRDDDFAKLDKDPFATGGFGTPGQPDFGGHDPLGAQGQDPFSQTPSSFGQTPAFSQPQQNFAPSFQQPSFAPQQTYSPPPQGGSDLQVISAKLDAIRATLDSINQRVASLERVAYAEQEPQKGRYQW